ncbi:MAG: hypothetical protein ACREES_09095, partial [Stellaceae bacterium]
MTVAVGIAFLLVGLAVGAAAAWIVARAEVRVAREALAAERAERRSEATAGIQQVAVDLNTHLRTVEQSIVELERHRAAGDASLRTTLDALRASDQELRTSLTAAA